MIHVIGRRQFFGLGALALAGTLVPQFPLTARDGLLVHIGLFDPTIDAARELVAIGGPVYSRVVALHGDPVHLWRELLTLRPQIISGFTRWSDGVLFRGLAAEHGMRVQRENDLSSGLGRPLFAWQVS